ncbi:MAG TPA: 30S ribosomal protein S27ae [archaeon]|nr:30S ribosomal protein S27ae [archaeon]
MAEKEAKGKNEKGKNKKMKKGSYYKMQGEAIERKNRFCPKCGPGVFMAAHASRMHCGNCGYTEFRTAAKQ